MRCILLAMLISAGLGANIRTVAAQPAPQPFQQANPAFVPPPKASLPPAEAALRLMIEAIAAGKTDSAAMTPELVERLQHVRTSLQGILREAGAIRSISVLTRSDDGQVVFAVTFEHGANQFSVRA